MACSPYVRLRGMLASHADLARKLTDLENPAAAQFKGVSASYRAHDKSDIPSLSLSDLAVAPYDSSLSLSDLAIAEG